jgi:hypothetical protein
VLPPTCTINPFEAMTTITVKIVNQLTGDLEFNSPQTLVAFRSRPHPVCHHALMNIYRALHRAQVSGAVRMTDMTSIRTVHLVRQRIRRDIGIKPAMPPNAASRPMADGHSDRPVLSGSCCCGPSFRRATPPSGRRDHLADRVFDEKVIDPKNKRATDPPF